MDFITLRDSNPLLPWRSGVAPTLKQLVHSSSGGFLVDRASGDAASCVPGTPWSASRPEGLHSNFWCSENRCRACVSPGSSFILASE